MLMVGYLSPPYTIYSFMGSLRIPQPFQHPVGNPACFHYAFVPAAADHFCDSFGYARWLAFFVGSIRADDFVLKGHGRASQFGYLRFDFQFVVQEGGGEVIHFHSSAHEDAIAFGHFPQR